MFNKKASWDVSEVRIIPVTPTEGDFSRQIDRVIDAIGRQLREEWLQRRYDRWKTVVPEKQEILIPRGVKV